MVLQVQWLVEDCKYDNRSLFLAEEVRRQGLTCQVFLHDEIEKKLLNSRPNKPACVVFQGSVGICELVKQERPAWLPGAFATRENFCCTAYYPHLKKYLLNADYVMMPLQMLQKHYGYFLETWGTFFIRPDSGAKDFEARVLGADDFATDVARIKTWADLSKHTRSMDIVVVAPPQKIHMEWRVICSKGEVITGSRYQAGGQLDCQPDLPERVRRYALEICSGPFQPDPVYVLDIGDVEGEGLKLVECGAFSSAGLYACDLEKVVARVSEIAAQNFESATFAATSPPGPPQRWNSFAKYLPSWAGPKAR